MILIKYKLITLFQPPISLGNGLNACGNVCSVKLGTKLINYTYYPTLSKTVVAELCQSQAQLGLILIALID